MWLRLPPLLQLDRPKQETTHTLQSQSQSFSWCFTFCCYFFLNLQQHSFLQYIDELTGASAAGRKGFPNAPCEIQNHSCEFCVRIFFFFFSFFFFQHLLKMKTPLPAAGTACTSPSTWGPHWHELQPAKKYHTPPDTLWYRITFPPSVQTTIIWHIWWHDANMGWHVLADRHTVNTQLSYLIAVTVWNL